MNNSLNSSMRTARPAPSPNLSMSQTRGSDMKVGRENFTDMLTRSLQNKEQSQIDTARSPATNKENDNMQASNSKDERVTDVSLSGFGGQVSRDNAILNTPGVNGTLLPLSFSNQDSSSSMVEQHSVGRAPGNETAAGVSFVSMDEERSRNEEKWELSDGTTNFKSDREPVGLVIPENFTVRKTFNQGEVGLHAYKDFLPTMCISMFVCT